MAKKYMFILGFLLVILEILMLARSPSFGIAGAFPVPGAFVSASNNNGPGSDSAITNSTGGYLMNESLTDIGNYTVEASANGYITADQNTTISSLSDKNTVGFILNRSAIIEGKVLGKNGQPVVGADVDLYENSTSAFVDQSQTDSTGSYYFATNVGTGAYYVTVTFYFPTYVLPPYQANPYLANGYVEYLGTSQIVSATQGAITVAPDIILNSSGVITGTVEDAGQPVANATVTAILSTYPYYSMTTTTDSSGTYRISYDVVNGTYTLAPSATGFAGYSVMVNATQTGTLTQNLIMFKTATLSGHVSRSSDSKPVPNVDVEVSNSTSNSTTTAFWYGFGTTNDSGNYAISAFYGLGPGNYTVYVSLQDFPVNTTSIILTAGENATLNFEVDAYFISGTVYANSTSTGTPLAYPDVSFAFLSPYSFLPSGYAISEENGTYLLAMPIVTGFNGLSASGNFTVSAYGYNTTTVTALITIGTDLANENFALPKSPPPPPPPPSATIMGTVYGNSGPSLPFSYQTWYESSSGYQFTITLNASSYIDYVTADLSTKSIFVELWGPEGTTGSLAIWIPDNIYQAPFTVTSIPGPNPTVSSTTDNGTYTEVQMTYGHSSKTIILTSASAVPEFQGPVALVILMVTLLFAAAIAIYIQKRLRIQSAQPKLSTL